MRATIYSTTNHDTLKSGDRWTCNNRSEACSVVIVAVDSYPEGIAVNILIELAESNSDTKQILAPVLWDNLQTELDNVVENDVDVTEYFQDYKDWKRLANEGQAGVWTCSLGQIVQTVL